MAAVEVAGCTWRNGQIDVDVSDEGGAVILLYVEATPGSKPKLS